MMSLRKNILIILAFILAPSLMFANEEHGHASAEEEEFNVTEMIMDHVLDNHSWHILDYEDDNGEEHAVAIPLPVILFHDGNLVTFMSSEFHHGHAVVTKGENHYFLHKDKVYITDEHGHLDMAENDKGEMVVTNAKPLDFSITKNVMGLFISALVLFLIFGSVARSYKKRPGRPAGLQAFIEPVILYVRDDIAKPNIGKKYHKFLPYLLTVFFFIFINNLLGLVPFFPGGANVTGNISVTLVLALFTMIITNASANKAYWKHIFNAPGVPWWLKIPIPIMPLVEFIGVLSKPFALMIRLFANITAGHIIVLSLISLIFIFKTAYMGFVSVPFVLFMDVLELLVAFIQAYVFTLLSALFIGLAVQDDHH